MPGKFRFIKQHYKLNVLWELIGYHILTADVALTFVTAAGKRLIGIGAGVRDTIAAMCSAYLFS